MENSFDVIVLGVGSMGSSACYHLAKAGVRVLGLEQSTIVHNQGSHHGQSRIIRQAYFEHPDYVPLLKRSYQLWQELSVESGEQLYTETGLLYAGRAEGALMRGIHESADQYGLMIRSGAARQMALDYPVLVLPDQFEVIIEPGAGFLFPEKCIRTYTSRAQSHGATIRTNEKVLGWKSHATGIEVKTITGTYSADRLVITAGPWASHFLPGMDKQLRVTRQTVFWIDVKNPERFTADRFPCWLAEHEDTGEFFYGFPLLTESQYGPPQGLKIAQHNPGHPADPDAVDRTVTDAEREHMRTIVEKFFPGQFAGFRHDQVCLYTYSPDEHFIIDVLPGTPRVVYAAGFSGHGFKFSSVVGEVLADLALKGRSEQPVGFLSAQRFR
jgi:sarcosine oxidase